MLVDLENLPESPEELKALLVKSQKEFQTQVKQRDSKIEILNDQVQSLKHQLYGRRSEKLSPEESKQAILFNEAEEVVACVKEKTEKIKVKSHARKKPGGRKPLPEDLPREEITVDISEEQKQCDCGHALKRIGEDISEKVNIIPQRVVIKKYIRPKYACSHCKGADADAGSIQQASLPPQILPKTRADAGLAAWSLYSKFNIHLPFYRQEQILKSLGIDIRRDDLSRYTISIGRALEEKVLPLMWSDLLQSPVIGADETPFKLLIRPGDNKKKVKQVYMHVVHGTDPPMVLFKYQPTRKIEFLREFLCNYSGVVMSDDFGGYNWLHAVGSKITHANCMAHVRRKFFEASSIAKSSEATEGLWLIKELYTIEKNARKDKLSPEKRLALRQERSAPIMKALHDYLLSSEEKAYPGHPFEKAVSYALKLWPRLQHFLNDGNIPIDNNTVENAIRPFALGRKNWLFAGAPAGASASAAVYSITESAKLHKHDVYKYLKYLFEELPKADTDEEIRKLLPYNLDRSKYE